MRLLIRCLAFITVFICCQCSVAYSQDTPSDIEGVNAHIDYTNEAIHGILIVHRLLENFNKDINAYVDLDDTKINFYSNADLDKDVFASRSFYPVTPQELYQKAKQHKVSPALSREATKLYAISQSMNGLRFDLEKAIKGVDLKDPEHLGKVYELLRKGEELYDQFFMSYLNILNATNKLESNQDLKGLGQQIKRTHDGMLNTLLNVRKNNRNGLKNELTSIQSTQRSLEKLLEDSPSKVRQLSKEIKSNVQAFSVSVDNYINDRPIPAPYMPYGSSYYYYNTDVITSFNWYGQGIVRTLNKLIDEANISIYHRMEIPHYFKVIYPERKEKIANLPPAVAKAPNRSVERTKAKEKKKEKPANTTIVSTPMIENIPAELKGRSVVNKGKVIKVSELEVEIEIYDHMIVDGDIISINYNGQWIVEEASLQKKPIKRKIKINKDGKNYIILHAINVGSRPPNTIAISYPYFGQQKHVILHSTLNESEVIEIETVR